jgi:hypothetical protein
LFFLPIISSFHYGRARRQQGSFGTGRAEKGLGYSKDLEMHKAAVALHFGIYNFVRVHKTLGTTPSVAAYLELERWSLERVVDMTRTTCAGKRMLFLNERSQMRA